MGSHAWPRSTRTASLPVCLAASLWMVLGQPVLAESIQTQRPPGESAPADTLRPFEPQPIEGLDDDIDVTYEAADWDSVMAAFDAAFREDRRERINPEVGLRYTKVEGVHVDAGASRSIHALGIHRIEARAGYDFSRKGPTALGLLRIRIPHVDPLSLELLAQSGATVFGLHDPYGNTLFALVAGYDARQYLLERGGHAMFTLRIGRERGIGLGWTRIDQRPLAPVANTHIFGHDDYMEWNVRADRVVQNGIRARFRARPAYMGETLIQGLVVEMDAAWYGGSLLGGAREYGRWQGDLWYTLPVWAGDDMHARVSGSLASGRAPVQALPDLGGAAGLRAWPPRGFDARNATGDGPADLGDIGDTGDIRGDLVGTQRLFSRLEYRWDADFLDRSRMPIARNLDLRLVPFVEVGSVWGASPVLAFDDLRAPRRHEVLWDLGFGLRRDFGLTGLLSWAQVDFAWPMGADTGPVRITLNLSATGLD